MRAIEDPRDPSHYLKRCPKCGKTRDSSAFGRHRGQSDGLTVWCRACRAKAYAWHRAQAQLLASNEPGSAG